MPLRGIRAKAIITSHGYESHRVIIWVPELFIGIKRPTVHKRRRGRNRSVRPKVSTISFIMTELRPGKLIFGRTMPVRTTSIIKAAIMRRPIIIPRRFSITIRRLWPRR
jgi:hypothetical protein